MALSNTASDSSLIVEEEETAVDGTDSRPTKNKGLVGRVRARLRAVSNYIGHSWRTSLQIRVIGSILVASAVVMAVLAFALVSVFTNRLLDAKLVQAQQEIDRARVVVEEKIATTANATTQEAQLQNARASVTQLPTESGESGGGFDAILVVENGPNDVLVSPRGASVPEELRKYVSEGQVSYQYAEAVLRSTGETYNAMYIGTPTNAEMRGLELYLVYSMESEAATIALMQGILGMAAVAVVVLLVAIAWLATQQVTRPVQTAARIAQRLASGNLKERMKVEGEDEMARLALSFNDMADKLSKQINQLVEYGDLQRQFTSDVSHELRTPLTSVRLAADLLADKVDQSDPAAVLVAQRMLERLDLFESLLDDLLEISRHDAGVADLSTMRIDARSPLEAAWESTRHFAESMKVDVTFDLPAEAVMINADSRRLERILRNLLANAVDHAEGKPVAVKMKANDNAVSITVTDNGVGLKPGQEELVFNRFWRADKSRKRHSGGTGLGLAIAKEDAALHGGRLEAAGTFGVGSQFRLSIPRDPDEGPLTLGTDPLPLVAPVAEASAVEASTEPDSLLALPAAGEGEPSAGEDLAAETTSPEEPEVNVEELPLVKTKYSTLMATPPAPPRGAENSEDLSDSTDKVN